MRTERVMLPRHLRCAMRMMVFAGLGWWASAAQGDSLWRVDVVENGRIVQAPAFEYQGHLYDYDTVPGDNDLPWLRGFAATRGIFSGIDLSLDWKEREVDMLDAIIVYTSTHFHQYGYISEDVGFWGREVLETMEAVPDSRWSCGHIAVAAIGIAQAHGIPARVSHGWREGSTADNICEFYSTAVNRWLVYMPHTGGWFAHEELGRLGTYGVRPLDAAGLNLKEGAIRPLIHLPSESRRYAPISPWYDVRWWERYFIHAAVTYRSFAQRATNRQLWYVAVDNWQNEQSGRNWPVFDELDDVDAPINNVVATVQVTGTEALVTLEHNLREFVRYEMSEDGGPWITLVPEATNQWSWTPSPDGVLAIRGVGKGEIHSPDVVLVACNVARDADSDGLNDCEESCVDTDSDGSGDPGYPQNVCLEDICPGFDDTVDTDNDSVPDGCDRCAGFDDAIDGDEDGVPDGCDVCPGFDDGLDADGDGAPDACEACPSEPTLTAPDEPNGESTCGDAVDNDCDGFTDLEDWHCSGLCPFPCGDMNNDGTVNLLDFAAFASEFGGAPESSQNATCADMNGDDEINLSDFATFATIFYTSPTSSPPNCL